METAWPCLIAGAATVLFYLSLTMMMWVVQWLSVPKTASRERQWQALVRSNYLAAPLILHLALLVLAPMVFLLPETAKAYAIKLLSLLPGVIFLYWLAVVLAGLSNLTGRSGGAMVWAGAKLLLAWLIILAALAAMPLSVMMWVLMAGSL